MKKRALRKDFYMEIRRNLGRFISIFLIVALGVAFYSGIQATAPDMRFTGNAYFDERQMMDLKVMGTMGVTLDDVKALEDLKEIRKAEPGYSVDVLAGKEGENDVLHMESLTPTLNKLDVHEGSLPQKAGECFLDQRYATNKGYQIGDVLEVREELEEDEEARLKLHKYTVTGIGSSPMYISLERGSSTLGSGTVTAFVYVTEESFDMEVYTQVYLSAEKSGEVTAFTEEYQHLADQITESVEGIKDIRCKARYDEVKADARQELSDAREELEEKKAEANEKLEDAREEIEDAEKKLKDGRKELADGKKEIADNKALLNTKQTELNSAKSRLAEGKGQLEKAKKELTSQEATFKKKKKSSEKKFENGEQQIKQAKKTIQKNEATLAANKKQLKSARKEYEAGKKQAEEAAMQIQAALQAGLMTPEQAAAAQAQAAPQMQKLEEARKQLEAGEQQLAAGEKELTAAKKTIAAKEKELAAGKKQLTEAEQKIKDGWKEISQQEEKLKEAQSQITTGTVQIAEGWQKISDAEAEIEKGEKEISDYEQELADGKKKYEDARKEADEKIADGEAKISDAEKEINKLKMPKWYLTTRDDMMDYHGYGENADRMKNIGEVFPVLFFLVAALISLTTMTRMVEEQRTQIGTLKALGYGKFSIAAKYLGYALIATLGGSIFGVLFGEKILPFIIIRAYGIMYPYMPNLEIPYNMPYALIATGTAVVCTLAATISACYHELAATPANLMRPPAPKQGKRVFLERITILWNHLSFTWKSTIRNLFRYKKRFFMTIFGIGGCMALLLVGFGLSDSIMDVAILQYDQLQFYDGMIMFDEEASAQEKEELEHSLSEEQEVKCMDDWYMKNLSTKSKSGSRDVYLVVPRNVDKFPEFVNLQDRITKESYELTDEGIVLTDEGIVLTEKASKLLEVGVGDTLRLELSEGEWAEAQITAITENYMHHYIYMTESYFEKIAGKAPEYNTLVFDTKTTDESKIEEIGERALTKEAALGISYTGTIKDQLDDMLGSLDIVLVVLIVSAGMLAFVVLYNLNNININERKRELATLKVLGFYDGEVAAYVYRENSILTLIGAGLGCILGKILHRFIIVTVEVDICMFGRTIKPSSFVFAILFTIGFSSFVNAVMYFKLKKIDMVESLKSVE